MFFLNLIVFTSLFYKTREILLQMWEGWICVEKKIVWSCNLWNIYSSSARAMKRMNHQVQGRPAVNSNKCYETFGNLHSQQQLAVSRVPDRSQVARYFSTRFCKWIKNDDNIDIDNWSDEKIATYSNIFTLWPYRALSCSGSGSILAAQSTPILFWSWFWFSIIVRCSLHLLNVIIGDSMKTITI